MNLKRDIEYYFMIQADYFGNIDLKLDRHENGATFYKLKTDGNNFEICIYENYESENIFFYRVDGVDSWQSNELGATVIDVDGLPTFLSGTKSGLFVKSFSELLTEYKNTNNLSVPALAKKIGVSFRTVEKWVSAERVPDIFKMKIILKSLDILK